MTEQEIQELEEENVSNIRWRHRRRMAYISLFAILVVTYWSLFVIPIERLSVLSDVITWFYFVMGSVVGAYVGFSAFEHMKLKTTSKGR